MSDRDRHTEMIRAAWDAYQADYMEFHLREWPRFHQHFAEGGLMLDDYLVEMLGDVKGLRLLDTSCACDAKQAFSWANLGATVTACDISPTAVAIAKDNAERIGLDVVFHVADAQTLTPILDASSDIVFATYLSWLEDLSLAYRSWHRVLRPDGRLLVHTRHPLTYWLENKDGRVIPGHDYQDTGPVYGDFSGTPLADRHGGWGRAVPCVEFHHTLAEVINAGLLAGLRLQRVTEASHGTDAVLGRLPTHIALLWSK
jgi:SAM-dependent methyltransferase